MIIDIREFGSKRFFQTLYLLRHIVDPTLTRATAVRLSSDFCSLVPRPYMFPSVGTCYGAPVTVGPGTVRTWGWVVTAGHA